MYAHTLAQGGAQRFPAPATFERIVTVQQAGRSDGAGQRAAGGLDRERIVDAALDVLSTEGLEALTMRRLARRLGTAPMSLYRHVDGKAELLALVVERIAESLPAVDAGGPWDVTVRETLGAIRRLLVLHPGIGVAVTSEALFTPSVLAAVEGLLGALRGAGLDEREAARTFVVLWNYTFGGAMVEQSLLPASAAGSPPNQDAEALLSGQRDRIVTALRLQAGQAPQVHAATAHWLEFESEEAFETGLDLLLAGIEATARR